MKGDLSAAHAARTNATLDVQVCVNGGEFMTRRALIEQRVAAGARVVERRGKRVLMNPEGSWLDSKNITKIGLDYAQTLIRERLYSLACKLHSAM